MSMSDIADRGSSNATVAAAIGVGHQHTSLNQQQHDQVLVQFTSEMTELPPELDEEIVNIPKELILISLVSQEQALYNPKHENYRNTQRKDAEWQRIAESVGWAEAQCKSKWKAMRDQYCRELKRSKFNAKANVKWKYFKELEFLRPYALSRNYRPRQSANTNINNNSNSFTSTITITNTNNNNNTTIVANNNSINSPNSITTTAAGINNSNNNEPQKYTQIKIEAGTYSVCEFGNIASTTAPIATSNNNNNTTVVAPNAAHIKSETARLLTPLTDEQLHSVMQHQADGNWNYLTATTTTPTTTNTNTNSEDALLCAFVNCVAAATAVGGELPNAAQASTQQQQHQQQQQLIVTHGEAEQQLSHISVNANTNNNNEDEDDDPIHTFLNIESYFEKELIAMIQQEDILYNSLNINYRNVKLKLEVWDEIARKLKKTVKQCRLKWKALRDQYIREHKRLKNRENIESLPRWKHYDALNFLQKYIRHKSGEMVSKYLIQIPKTEMDTDMDDHLINSNSPLHVSPLHSPTLETSVATHDLHQSQQQQQQQQQLHTLPLLTGPHTTQQQQQQQQQQQFQTHHDNPAICVMNTAAESSAGDAPSGVGGVGGVSGGSNTSVGGYDEMDIDNYIIGDGSNEAQDDDGIDDDDDGIVQNPVDDEEEEEMSAEHKSQQFPHFSHNSNSNQQHTSATLALMNGGAESVEFQDIKSLVAEQQQQQKRTQEQEQGLLSVNINESLEESMQTTTQLQQQHTHQMQKQQQQQLINDSLKQHQQQHQQQQHQDFNTTSGSTTTSTSSLLLSTLGSNSATPTNNLTTNSLCDAMPPISTSTSATLTTLNNSEDDEVGAFFKAVAMKIRNAKLSPVAFTDLQIDILRVINSSLRHH